MKTNLAKTSKVKTNPIQLPEAYNQKGKMILVLTLQEKNAKWKQGSINHA